MTAREALSRTLLLARDTDVLGENDPTDAQLLRAFGPTTVLLVADAQNLAAPAGQHALVALFSLVARLGVTVYLDVPDVAVLGYQPPLRGDSLRDALLDLGRDLIPGRDARAGAPAEADFAFVLGDTPWRGAARTALRLVGDAWSGAVVPAEEPGQRWRGDWPVGALVAAGIAAPEPYKHALRALGARLPNPVGVRYLQPVVRARLSLAPTGTPTPRLRLGAVDAVSGGAITHAAFFAVLRLPGVRGRLRVIEPDRAELSNTNRYMLLRRSDRGRPKTRILESFSLPGLPIEGLDLKYEPGTRDRIRPLAPRVLVGVDDIAARWTVQRDWPVWLGVGATSHYMAMVSEHARGAACAGCAHPRDDEGVGLIPTVGFVSYWAGLLLAARLICRVIGDPVAHAERQALCWPLRWDQPHALYPQPLPRRSDCPGGCAAWYGVMRALTRPLEQAGDARVSIY